MSEKRGFVVSTPLNDAVESGNLELMKSLLQNGADPNAIDDEGTAPLNLICNQLELNDLHLSMMQQLLKFNADVNINKNLENNSPMIQLFNGKRKGKLRYEALKLLLENNADVMQVNRWGNTVLNIILYQKEYTNTVELIKLLMKHSVDVKTLHNTRYYPLTLAINFPSTEVAEFLLKNGADPNRINNCNDETLLFRICNKESLNYMDFKMVQLLIQYKADVNLQAPILALFRCKYFTDQTDVSLRKKILKLFLENNADALAACEYQGSIPRMILGRMKYNDTIEIIKLLWKYGLDVNTKHKHDFTLLHYAAHMGIGEEMSFFLQHEANPNTVDVNGNTPLNAMCDKYHIEGKDLQAFQYLLRYQVDVNIQNDKGNTPIISLFHRISEYQLRYEVLKLLLKKNANVAHLNNKGKTVLHVIIQTTEKRKDFFDDVDLGYRLNIEEIYRCMELIMQHGLDINVQDRNGFSLLNEAISYCNLDLVKFLFKHGSKVTTAQFQGGYFQCQNNVLPDLWMTQKIFAIIDILENEGFQIKNNHYLSVMKFLVGYYVPIKSLRLKDALKSGSTYVILNYIKSKDLSNPELDMIYNYLYLAKYRMVYMDQKTYHNLQSSVESLDSRDHTHDSVKIKENIEKYIKDAKKVIIVNKTSLLEILASSPDKMYLLLKNCDYQSVVNSQHFYQTFNGISSILQGHINKSLVRGFAKNVSLNPMRHLTKGLPHLCCEYIIEHLNDNELCCMYESLNL
ncbi:hypothetical protein TKK_0006404 [Trichogramma kaykai]|uniref:Uncharacterized protein n=1 Tax=Trichogramma kaykai TaxID=54128 RepID=A0ABD2XDC8_9HYME